RLPASVPQRVVDVPALPGAGRGTQLGRSERARRAGLRRRGRGRDLERAPRAAALDLGRGGSAALVDGRAGELGRRSRRRVRAAGARPQVIGSTRQVVQGAVDIVDETWDAGTRTLRAKSVNLDGRKYAVTIAVPKGMRPGGCKADVPCTVKRLESGHAVLEWPAGGDGRDIHWELSFRLSR